MTDPSDTKFKEFVKNCDNKPVNLYYIYTSNAVYFNNITPKKLRKLINSGKTLALAIKERTEELKASNKVDKDFIYIDSVKLRVRGIAQPTDLTKARYNACIHRAAYMKKLIDNEGKPFLSPLIKQLRIPEEVLLQPDATLIGKGMHFNYSIFRNKKVAWYGAIVMDYMTYRNKTKRTLSIMQWMVDGTEEKPETQGMIRQSVASPFDEYDTDQIKIWLLNTNFNALKISKRRSGKGLIQTMLNANMNMA